MAPMLTQLPTPLLVVLSLLALCLLLGGLERVFSRNQAASLAEALNATLRLKPLMTETELRFYRRLRKLCPNLPIATQVAMAAVIQTQLESDNDWFWQAYNRYSRKIIDFVVFDERTGDALLVIELDDYSHDNKKAQDAARDAMLAAAGLKTVRFDCRSLPTDEEIRRRIDQALGTAPAGAAIRAYA